VRMLRSEPVFLSLGERGEPFVDVQACKRFGLYRTSERCTFLSSPPSHHRPHRIYIT
jgi:hypothetical protein